MMFRLSQVFMLCLTHSLLCATTQTVEDIRKRCFEQRVDLVFVVDASYSVKVPNFERAKSFINKIVSGLPIGPTAVRVALVRFDRDVSIINHFLDNLQAVTDSVWNMTYPDAVGTNTGGALKKVREQVFDVRKEDGVKDIVITITDGESDQVDVTEEQAGFLRDQGAQLVWLYIYKGGGPLEDEKTFMEEQGDSVIVVDHFDKLTDDIVSKMLVASCPDQTIPSTTTSTVLKTDIQTTNPSTPVASTEDDSTTTASVDFLVSTTVTVTEQPSITTESPVVTSSSSASASAESSTADIWIPDAEMTSEANLITSPTEKFDLPVTHAAADLPVLTLSIILLGQWTTAVRDVTHTATEQTKESFTKEKDDDSALNHMWGTPPWSPAALRMTTYPANTPRLAQAWCCNGLPWYQYWLFIGTTIGSSSEVIGGPPLAQDWLSLGRILAPMYPPFYPNIRPVYLIGQSCAKHALPTETPHSTTIAPTQ